MPTDMSAFGVELRLGRAQNGDRLYCAGIPLVGEEVLKDDAVCFSLAHLKRLFMDTRVHAVIPCGSQGIEKEAHVIAKESGLSAVLDEVAELDLKKSAGPSTCAVFAADSPAEYDFELGIPVICIGHLTEQIAM